MSCEVQLAWKCLFTPTFSAGDFDQKNRSSWDWPTMSPLHY